MKIRFVSRSRTLAALAGLGLVLSSRCPSQTVTSIHQFAGTNAGDGAQPFLMHLIQATDGNFYGTTEVGGTNGPSTSVGTVFKMTPAGAVTVLYSFKSGTVNDGEFPEAGLVQASDGNLYGTTYEGGTNFYGTVFRITPAGVYTNLHVFQPAATHDGRSPFSPLTQGTNGLLYGTTSAGGTRGYGTVYSMDFSGNVNIVYSFSNGPDGNTPYAGVIQGSDGLFYGTTQSGGTNSGGTVYKVSAGGAFVLLYSFGATPTDGQNPIGGLIQGWDGNYYGTTFDGGTNGSGIVFRITSSGTLTHLYDFGAFAYDGLNPRTGLLQGSDGYLYGTTYLGGTNGNAGTLFKIGLTGGIVYLHDFDNFIGDGVYPDGALVEGYDGNYYGVTYQGGTNFLGVVYKFAYPVPQNPNEPKVTETGNPDGTNTAVISFPSVAGETYQLQFVDSLPATIWSNVPGATSSNALGGPLSFTNFVSSGVPKRFYRLEITP